MSRKKAKKLRRPNIPLAVGGGAEITAEVRASRGEPTPVAFDYRHIKKDLTRIGLLAVSFIAVLVALSFFIK